MQMQLQLKHLVLIWIYVLAETNSVLGLIHMSFLEIRRENWYAP